MSFPDHAAASLALPAWPLRTGVCTVCWLIQLIAEDSPSEVADPVLDGLADTSETLRAERGRTVDALVEAVPLGPSDTVYEMASHGNHLTRQLAAHGIAAVTLDPDPERVERLRAAGVASEAASFTPADARRIVASHGPARLVVDDYLLSHHGDLDAAVGFLAGLLGRDGVLHVEFDHALSMVEQLQFDVIRHGHATYLSLLALRPAFERHGLSVVDATVRPTYGGAVQATVRRTADVDRAPDPRVAAIIESERAAGLADPEAYARFGARVDALRRSLRDFLVRARADGDAVVGYGAPSRAATLLGSSGVTAELLPYTVDRAIAKHGRFIPGTAIEIDAPTRLMKERPRYVLILSWTIADEVMAQLGDIGAWDGRFVVPIPSLQVRRPGQPTQRGGKVS